VRISLPVIAGSIIAAATLSGCQGSLGSAAGARFLPGHGYEAQGQIHPHDEDKWCLTTSTTASTTVNYDPIYVEPCTTNNDVRQIWHIVQVSGVGQIQMYAAPFSIGQHGALTTARLIKNDSSEATKSLYTVTLTEVQHEWWTITLPTFRFKGGAYLTTPKNLNGKTDIYGVYWQSSQPPATANQNWDLPVFHEVN